MVKSGFLAFCLCAALSGCGKGDEKSGQSLAENSRAFCDQTKDADIISGRKSEESKRACAFADKVEAMSSQSATAK